MVQDKGDNDNLGIGLLGGGVYLSVRHLKSAVRLSKKATDCGEAPEDLDLCQAFVLGSIGSACDFIESNINELYAEAAEHDVTRLASLGASAVDLLASVWKRGVPSKASLTTIEKYELALDFAVRGSFDRSDPRFLDVLDLSRLHDTLKHFDTNWILNHGDPRRVKLEREVFETKMLSRFGKVGDDETASILSSKCGVWSVATAVGFVDYFYEMMSIDPPYADLRKPLGLD